MSIAPRRAVKLVVEEALADYRPSLTSGERPAPTSYSADEDVLFVTAAGEVTLPTAGARSLTVVALAIPVVLLGAGGATISGAANLTLLAVRETVTLLPRGSNWERHA
jgi:hypothetical protein